MNMWISSEKLCPSGKALILGKEMPLWAAGKSNIYYVDGFIKSDIMEHMFHVLYRISEKEMDQRHNTKEFIKYHLPYAQATAEKNTEKMMKALLSGLVLMVIDGYSEVIVMDLRDISRQER